MVHVALFAFPEQGHINPMLQLSLHLAAQGAHVTLVNTEQAHQKLHVYFEHLQQTYPHFHCACIPDGLPAHLCPTHDVVISGSTSHGDVSSTAMPALLESLEKQGPAALEQLLSDLNRSPDRPPLSCLISDAFMPWTAQVARNLQLSWVVFWAGSATQLYLTGVKGIEDKSVIIPGIPPLSTDVADRPPPPNPQKRRHLQARCEALKKADILLLNTFDGIEEEAIRNVSMKLAARAVGPLCLNAGAVHGSVEVDGECMSWLNKQAVHSVLYISFGSKLLLQGRPLEQLALGIEASKMPFLWVLRSSREELPEGFLEMTQERGMITSWVPQQKVLEHCSIGAFFTHCGWNSVLEALVEGVPMICWPFFADQPINRVLIEQKWRTGKGIQGQEVSGDDIRQVIQDVMRDDGMRHRASLLGISAKSAMSEGGRSQQNLSVFLVRI